MENPVESCTVEVENHCEGGTEVTFKDECHTDYTQECHDDHCQKVPVETPHHHCHKTTGPKLCKNLETCTKVPVKTKYRVCKPEQRKSCHEVPSRSCGQVSVRVPRRVARRVCNEGGRKG